jgi:hypothetical protein
MSFNIGNALVGGVEGLFTGGPVGAAVGAVAGGCEGGSSSATSSAFDPSTLESALSQQSSAFTNINTLSSFAQGAPQSDNLLASLIDGDSDGD